MIVGELPWRVEYKGLSWQARQERRKAYRKAYDRTYRATHSDQIKVAARAACAREKIAVFEAYGGVKCVCCGETERTFLTLDHVNNDGTEDRKKRGMGSAMYAALRRAGYPPGYQVLCSNCNLGRAHNGGTCPHKERP